LEEGKGDKARTEPGAGGSREEDPREDEGTWRRVQDRTKRYGEEEPGNRILSWEPYSP